MLIMIILMRMMTETTRQMFNRSGDTIIVRDVIGRSKENMNSIVHLNIWACFYRQQELFSRGYVCFGLCTVLEPQILRDDCDHLG
jgi:hypothetical protein